MRRFELGQVGVLLCSLYCSIFHVKKDSCIISYERGVLVVETDIQQAGFEKTKVLTKAVIRTATLLNLSAKDFAQIIGVSEASVSRMKEGHFDLKDKSFELAVLLVRLFRSLDAIAGGDNGVVRAWLHSENEFLKARPVNKIKTITGLIDVINYLDARRALI